MKAVHVRGLPRPHWLCGLSLFHAARRVLAILCAVVLWQNATVLYAQSGGSIEIDLLEEGTDNELVCRLQILDIAGKPQKARGAEFQSGWVLAKSPMLFKSRIGNYTYRAYHGPEYAAASGGFTLDTNASAVDVLRLPRHANLLEEGWIGGDMASSLAALELLPWLEAEGLHLAVSESSQVQAPTAEESTSTEVVRNEADERWVEPLCYVDNRAGSGLAFHHWMPPAAVPASLPSSRLLVMAKAETKSDRLPVHVEVTKPWERDLPIWLASGRVDTIRLLGEHLTFDGNGGLKVEPLVEPDGNFQDGRRAGKLVEAIYWQMLEAGLRIPPSAGSGFGKGTSHLGYNRVYAAIGSPTRDAWWQALREGQTFVTSGPLLRAEVNRQLPGHVFEVAEGESLEIDVALTLTVADPVDYLDVVFNGQAIYQARLDEYAKAGGKIPKLQIKESGWIVIRVVTERDFTYRIATTAPYFVEFGGQPRVSASAVEFFQGWLERATAKIEALPAEAREQALPYARAAGQFWAERLAKATAK